MITTTLFIGDENGLRDSTEFDGRKARRGQGAKPDAEYGNTLRQRRLELGLTQRQLADHIGIHDVSLSRLENGIMPLTVQMHDRIESIVQFLEED